LPEVLSVEAQEMRQAVHGHQIIHSPRPA
jgi:hypothetical protein